METGTSTVVVHKTAGDRIGGWLDNTLGEGKSALCKTICSPCVLLCAIFVLFNAELTFVTDQENILKIEGDMVEVTMWDAKNNDKPVAFFTNSAVASTITDSDFNVQISNSMKIKRNGHMVTKYVSSTTTSQSTTTVGSTETTTYKCELRWSTTKGTQSTHDSCSGEYNNYNFKSPCPQGTSCSDEYEGTVTANGFTISDFLIDYYTGRETALDVKSSDWGNNWQAGTTSLGGNAQWFDCGLYLANNYREISNKAGIGHSEPPLCRNEYTPVNGVGEYVPTKALAYDHTVSWRSWPLPAEGFTICSKQTANKDFVKLDDDDHGRYDLMLKGKKTKQDCIDEMNERAKNARDVARIFGFLLFWCGFCCMFSFVSFFADRLGSLIPCGLGDMFSDCVDAIICIVTCPPACACWLFWFTLAWFWVRPMPYGLLFALSIVLMGAMYWWFKQQEGKKEDEPEKEEPEEPTQPMTNDQQAGWNNMNQPWTNNDTPTQPPPPAETNDADGDGIPDEFQAGLPPGWTAALDHSSNRVYWINNSTVPPSSTWQDPRQPSAV